MSDPHGTPRTSTCTRTSCTKRGLIRDDEDRDWCPDDYALIYLSGDDLERFLCASAATLARRGQPLPQAA